MSLHNLNKIGLNRKAYTNLIHLYKYEEPEMKYGRPIGESKEVEVIKLFCFVDNKSFTEEYKYDDVEMIRTKTVFVCRNVQSLSTEDLLTMIVKHKGKSYKINRVMRDEVSLLDMELECEVINV